MLYAFIKATVTSLAINAIWMILEFKQYKTLQWDRKCDNVVFLIYWAVLWYLFL